MKIIIIEDNEKIASFLTKGLKEEKFSVEAVNNAAEGVQLCKTVDHDLLVLDLMLPDIDGFDVIKTLRKYSYQKPIMILSARNLIEDKILGLDLGADDYMVKPFSFEEFLARVRALLRRKPNNFTEKFIVDEIEINLLSQQVFRKNKLIELTNKEYSLLVYLVQNKNKVLSRTKILENIWDMNYDSDTNIVDVFIRHLRKKIDEPFEKKYIQTVRGSGYQFKAPE